MAEKSICKMAGILDDSQRMKALDAEEMLAIVEGFDQQLEKALEIGLQADIYPPIERIQNILVCGLGGSAIGGDLLCACLSSDLKVPIQISRNYSIPAFAGPSTLVFVCSYSGNTEETIAAFHAAREAGCFITCLTSGGQILELARQNNYATLKIPGGLPPRTALGYLMVPLLVACLRLGLTHDRIDEVQQSVRWVRSRIEQLGRQCPLQENVAKQLAIQLQGKIPVVYGSQGRLEMVARRWCGQISENGKQVAYSSCLPEMTHNEIAGWKWPPSILQQFVPIFLRDRKDHSRVQIRAEITRGILAETAETCLEFWTEGESWLDRLWSLILLGDFASIYLAFLNGENPTPVPTIEGLKQRLKEASE